ncbi:MAG: hypothetical protein P1P89_01130 [Desulfobacterales bacterium]|nr:hypothetical protein [Desulfobacterales bacterium]
MTTNEQNTTSEQIVSPDNAVRKAQRVRLQRFGMALCTYVLVIPAIFLALRLGLGDMSDRLLAVFIGLALVGNGVFFVLF